MSFVNCVYLALLILGLLDVALIVLLITQRRRHILRGNELEKIRQDAEQQIADLRRAKGLVESLVTPSYGISRGGIVDICGYSKSAVDLTGDFYQIMRISPDRVVTILGDVSGHGFEAALISVIVVTVFDEWCARWQPDTSLLTLAERINDAVESRGFRGKFVAFGACLLDVRTGEAELMNMGGEPIFVYRAAKKSVDTIKLTHLPAAGCMPWDLIQAHSMPKPHRFRVEIGDALLFLSEGLEDSRRRRRTPPATGAGERDVSWEEFGYDRIRAVLVSTMSRGTWTLDPDSLVFDFSGCTGTAEEVVLALAAAEKVFRLLPHQLADETGTVVVDPPLDLFLQKYFRQFDKYLGQAAATEDGSRRFGRLAEDPQLDDLTVLALRRITPTPAPRPHVEEIATPVEEIPESEAEDIEELPGVDDDEGELLPV